MSLDAARTSACATWLCDGDWQCKDARGGRAYRLDSREIFAREGVALVAIERQYADHGPLSFQWNRQS